MEKKKTTILDTVTAVGRGIDISRRIVLNLLFLFILVVLLAALAVEPAPQVPETTALVVAPQGRIVDQLTGDPTTRAIQKLTGGEVPETLSKDLVDAILAARDDERVKALLLDLDQMLGAGWGLSKLQDVKAAINDFKESGKPVIATADIYDTSRYYLATAADEIYLHRMGGVVLEGYGRFRTYYKKGLDKFEVDWHVFRVGEFKSAVEPYVREDMSEEARTANLGFLSDLWDSYLEDVAGSRNTTREAIEDSILRLNDLLREAGGQAAEVALRVGLVDHVGGRDALRNRLIELVGENRSTHSFERIDFLDYLEALGTDRSRRKTYGDGVGVVVAKGNILFGDQPPGMIGGDSTAALIRKARHNHRVKALVLRVDSGGGSAFASEVIRRELELVREAGKPVVVSMGTLAASGGYWISTASDEIWANPNTITGSIGAYAMFPTFQKPLAKYLGMRVDGVGTTWLSEVRPERELPEKAGEMIQLTLERTYQDFLRLVSEARGMSVDEVHSIGQGRIWSGADALGHGLVDQLGGLPDAIASAAQLAGLGDDYAVRYIEKELDFEDRLMLELLSDVSAWYRPDVDHPRSPLLQESLVTFLSRQAEMLSRFNDPNGIYADCLCDL
ncbi:MAG: signal peptide peptidase SppA [bacterium]|nr:signal peptide peptidase SppA [bacterium]